MMIRLNAVCKSYSENGTWAVRDVNLQIEAGELLVLLGESGCGKTTTLKMINRLVEPTSGEIEVDGKNIKQTDSVELRRGIGYVFQNVGLFPHMTVCENVAVVPQLLRWDSSKIQKRINELLSLVSLPSDEFRDRFPRKLSGGQRQRVGLARALAAQPKIMLMDEPFGALDPLTRDSLQEEFKRIHKKLNLTTVMVTHDMTEALLLADRIAVMCEGRVVTVGTPHELLSSSQEPYVQQLMNSPKHQADRLEALMKEGN